MLFRSIESSNYGGGVDIRTYPPPTKKETIISFFTLSNICFVCEKETSQGDVSFTNIKHMLLFKKNII